MEIRRVLVCNILGTRPINVLKRYLRVYGMCLQWANDLIKRLTCFDYALVKIGVFAFSLMLAKLGRVFFVWIGIGTGWFIYW